MLKILGSKDNVRTLPAYVGFFLNEFKEMSFSHFFTNPPLNRIPEIGPYDPSRGK